MFPGTRVETDISLKGLYEQSLFENTVVNTMIIVKANEGLRKSQAENTDQISSY